MTLSNPVFTATSTLTSDADVNKMTFTTSTDITGEAYLVLDSEFNTWLSGGADASKIAEIENIFDGYARSFEITTNATEDHASGEIVGLCWNKGDYTTSCATWLADGAGSYQEKSWYSIHGSALVMADNTDTSKTATVVSTDLDEVTVL